MGNPPMISKAKLMSAIFIAAVVVWGMLNVNFLLEKAIDAGKIEIITVSDPSNHGLDTSEIKGSFKVYTPMLKHSIATIPSEGIGGACLVADLKPYNIPTIPTTPGWMCSKNSECQTDLSLNHPGWLGYCDAGTGKCWIKPGGDKFCNKSIMHPGVKKWEDGFTNTVPKSPHYFQVSTSDIDWRVVACLNKLGSTTENCGDPNNLDGKNKLQVFGEPTPVKYKPF